MTAWTGQVAAGSDDTFRGYNANAWDTVNYYFIAGYDSSYNGAGSAARFLNVPIPRGSVIVNAFFRLVGSSSSGTVVRTRLRAQLAINPLTFTTQGDFDARVWTDAFVNWDDIAAWTNGVTYDSPDISTIIQEIIDQAQWESGNAIVILWDDWQQRSTQGGATSIVRSAEFYDHSPSQAPRLLIEYTAPPTLASASPFAPSKEYISFSSIRKPLPRALTRALTRR